MHSFRLIYAEYEILESAVQFLKLSDGNKHFAFYGAMGAGKTTFIKALCNSLGTTDLVSSPSFAIVNEYLTLENIAVYHFDFFRIKSSIELYDIGFEDYCRNDAYCFIEWPEKGEELIPSDFVKVYIAEQSDGRREIIVKIPQNR
jgi:tRNA threonylcarbamoyladenosine biosynthesis protein TsaE